MGYSYVVFDVKKCTLHHNGQKAPTSLWKVRSFQILIPGVNTRVKIDEFLRRNRVTLHMRPKAIINVFVLWVRHDTQLWCPSAHKEPSFMFVL